MIPETEANVLDLTALAVIISTLAGWLPRVAALLAIVWTGIRIWESPTTQKLITWIRSRI